MPCHSKCRSRCGPICRSVRSLLSCSRPVQARQAYRRQRAVNQRCAAQPQPGAQAAGKKYTPRNAQPKWATHPHGQLATDGERHVPQPCLKSSALAAKAKARPAAIRQCFGEPVGPDRHGLVAGASAVTAHMQNAQCREANKRSISAVTKYKGRCDALQGSARPSQPSAAATMAAARAVRRGHGWRTTAGGQRPRRCKGSPG